MTYQLEEGEEASALYLLKLLIRIVKHDGAVDK